ncbi:MAG: signal peptidase I [Kiritimatiellae bacterium]|nr:signal peptidase I [Kiritimatiellia bacterium]
MKRVGEAVGGEGRPAGVGGVLGAAMRWWQWRRLRKTAREALQHARHVRAMREDVAGAPELAGARTAEERLAAALRARRAEEVESALEELDRALRRLAPPRRWPRAREFVEIAAVAGAVAMALRCYFVQPFRIPTGSMMPTLYGVQIRDQVGRRWYDWPPLSWVGWALFGEGYVEVRARCNGYVGLAGRSPDDEYDLIPVFAEPPRRGVPALAPPVLHRARANLPRRAAEGAFVTEGELLASGRVKIGDHVFVDKVRYNFLKPRRGDIIVFDVTRVDFPGLRGDFYIKRLAGLPGEQISIHPPHLVVNGRPVESPYPFHRLLRDPRYHGYELATGPSPRRPKLADAADVLALGPEEYLPLGDNTRSSLDGRYFGPVKAADLVGPAFAVYWPLSRRWGWVR